MPKRRALDLSGLDDKLIDGLKFCTKVYDLFDDVLREPDGIGKIRLQASKREKRLIEELLPITQYVQARYRVGNRFKIRWLSGSQGYDAKIWTPLTMVIKSGMPRSITLEVTISRHEFTHIARRQLHEEGGSFGPKGIRIDKKTNLPVFSPHVYTNDEHVVDLVQQINGRISAKAKKQYPRNTVLIVSCETDGLILEDEWKEAIRRVESEGTHKAFREVFLCARYGQLSATLWGSGNRKVEKKQPHAKKP